MSSPEKETSELKGGHAPAVKAGGMRITQHKVPHNEKASAPEKIPKKEGDDENPDEEDEETEVVSTSPRQNLVISGAPARGDEDFPSAAIKAFHDKPMATNEFRPNVSKTNIIHQPRK